MRKDIICGYIAVSVGDLNRRITYLPDGIVIDIGITDYPNRYYDYNPSDSIPDKDESKYASP